LLGTHLAVAQAIALVLLARNGASLRRTVRFAATSEGAGGRGVGLRTLARCHLEHITSDIAIGWGGLSWVGSNQQPCALLATADKGALRLRLRAEGGGGSIGASTEEDPADRLVRALGKLADADFPPRPSRASRALSRSLATILPPSKSQLLEGLGDAGTAAQALEAMERDREIELGVKAILRASVCTQRSVVRVEACAGDGFRPSVAEADLVYCYPPGEDVEALARAVLEALAGDGVYLSEKAVQPPSETEPSPEVQALASAALTEVDPRAQLVVGLAPWPTGLSALRDCGTSVFGWEPFSSGDSLRRTLARRGASGEALEAGDFVREVRAIYSFLCRASL
jgi:acetylornithine deacetylase/succinyl-diaminopimelate desuccinylase-like protein